MPEVFHRRLVQTAKRAVFAGMGDRLLVRFVLARLPRSANVEVTTACNLACPLCPTHIVPRASRTLGVELVQALLADAGGALKSVCLHVQGEPSLHPRLYDIVRLFGSYGVEVWFGTNGMLVEKQLDELFDSGLDGIAIDLDGVDAEDYGRYRKRGDFERVLGGLRALIAEKARRGAVKPFVQVQMVMFSYNERRLPEVRELLDGLGADRVHLKRPAYELDLEEGRRRGLELEPAVAERVESAANAFLEEVEADNTDLAYSRRATGLEGQLYRNRRLCPQLERATVLSDGRVVACCMDALGTTTFGDLNEEPFDQIWRGLRHARTVQAFLDRKLSVCETCTLT
ncbi:MAG: radical SAM protein [Planctomycetota bacterium]|nr:radical SAM protein [Planctomycetota bacterium]